MTKLRTRYRIVFLYKEEVRGKCEGSPFFHKDSGATDGDAFDYYVEYAEQVYDAIPKKCLIKDGSGVCIVVYEMKEKFFYKEVYTPKVYAFKARVHYELTTRKDGVKIAYKVNPKTGKKTQYNYKKARKNNTSQQGRMRRSKNVFAVKQVARKKSYDARKSNAESIHRKTKKRVLKQYQMFGGCYSPDMAYK